MKEFHKTALDSLWNALSHGRSKRNIDDQFAWILLMLLWAKWIPQTTKEFIGYFDSLESINFNSTYLVKEISRRIDLDLSEICETNKYKILEGSELEELRNILMPAARLVAKDDIENIDFIIREIYFLKSKVCSRNGAEWITDPFVYKIANDIFRSKKIKTLGCLYPLGSGLAPLFASENKTSLMDVKSPCITWPKAYIKLYGASINQEILNTDSRPDAIFSAPPWNQRTNDIYDIWSPINEEEQVERSKTIKDLDARRIYFSHLNTKKITISLVPPRILFQTSKGLTHFRKTIIENNWLDAVIQLPNGMVTDTNIQSVLLIMSKERSENDPIYFYDCSGLKKKDKAEKYTFSMWDENELNKLIDNIINKKKVANSAAVKTKKLESNGYDLNFKNYILSKEEKNLLSYLDTRKSAELGEIAELIRPLSIERDSKGSELSEAMISDINYLGLLEEPVKRTLVKEGFVTRANPTFIKKGDLLISIKGTIGKVALVTKELKETIPGPSLCILRIHDQSRLSPESLLLYLRSSFGQQIISSATQGTTIPFLPVKSIKSMKIIIPTLEEEKVAKRTSKKSIDLFNSINEMQKELNKLVEKGWLQIEGKGGNK